jgi:hypothetical protein
VPGDFYLDVATREMYGPARSAGPGTVAWGQPFQLVGPSSPGSANGATGNVSGQLALAGKTRTSLDPPLQLGLSAVVAVFASLLTLGVTLRRRPPSG